jgi:hypothetical protein
MSRVMFSIHVGDSMAHVLRTRELAKHLSSKGHEIGYSVPQKASKFLVNYIKNESIYFNDQDYSYARFEAYHNGSDNFFEHANKEATICEQFNPNVIIGDPGLVTHAYRPEAPLLKIVDRFYLEIITAAESPYTNNEKEFIRNNAENVINTTRRRLGIFDDFTYYEAVKPPALINGASYFVEGFGASYKFIGNHMALKPTTVQQPDYRNCFVAFGTGLADHMLGTASAILKYIESRFRKIYVSFGTKVKREQLYQPANAIMEPMFNEVPDDIGVLICHGGYGISHLGVQLDIPVIITPFQIEQFSNGYRLEKLGVGINAGTYDKSNFKGLYEKIQINWDRFDFALDNLSAIRTAKQITDRFDVGENLLFKYTEEFINSI